MLSIIVPIYGVEPYLRRCVDSILAQTYRDIEVVLVDDGSPDGCLAICDEYARKDDRVVVIHQPNKGVSAARNAGLAAAKGEYIGFCDPDDFIAPEMYEKMVGAMESCNVELVICGYDYYDEAYHKEEARAYLERPDEHLSQEQLYGMLSDMPPTIKMVVWNKLYKKELLDGLSFDASLHYAEDGDFLLGYFSRVDNTVFVHAPLYKNLIRMGSAQRGGVNVERIKDSFVAFERIYRESAGRYPRLREHATAYLLDALLLKYNEYKRRGGNERKSLRYMRRRIRRYALGALFNKEIYWKTRIAYLIVH